MTNQDKEELKELRQELEQLKKDYSTAMEQRKEYEQYLYNQLTMVDKLKLMMFKIIDKLKTIV